jgi:hypothetical protein
LLGPPSSRSAGEIKAAVRPSAAARDEITHLKGRLRVAIQRRNAADRNSMQLLQGVVFAVKGERAHGEDGALYEAMGYVRWSARRKRKRKK